MNDAIPSFEQPRIGPPTSVYRYRTSAAGNLLVDRYNRLNGRWYWIGYERTWRNAIAVMVRLHIADVWLS